MPVIEPEHVRVQVALQVLGADNVVHPIDPALGVRPKPFDVVRMGAAGDVLFGGMDYRPVGIAQAGQAPVRGVFVGEHNGAVGVNVFLHHRDDGIGPVVGLDLDDGLPVALHHSNHGSLADCAPPGVEFLAFVFVGLFATDIGFVNLHVAKQLQAVFLGHEFPDLLEHPPSGFVGDAGLTLQLFCRYARPRRGHEEYGIEPGPQAGAGLVKDGIGAGRNVGRTSDAGIDLATLDAAVGGDFTATLAVDTVRPAQILQIIEASILGGEFVVELLERVLFHAQMIAKSTCVVKG